MMRDFLLMKSKEKTSISSRMIYTGWSTSHNEVGPLSQLRVWRHHRECFVFNVEMYWHIMTSLLVISCFEFEFMSLFQSAHFKLQGFVNHFANHNCVLKNIMRKVLRMCLQIFLRLKRLLTPIPQVKYLSTDIWHCAIQKYFSRSSDQFQAIKIAETISKSKLKL